MKEFHSASLLATPPDPLDYIVDGLLLRGGGGDVAGMPGSCKSTILLSMSAAISTGASWFGLRTACTPAAWISGEASSEKAIQRDIHRLHVGESDILFMLPDDVMFRWIDDQWITTQEGRAVIDRIRVLGIGFIVMDTIGSLVAGLQEVNNDQQRQLARHLRHELDGLTWLTVSHTNQSSAKDTLAWRLHYLSRAGGNGFPGAVRWAAGATLLSGEDDALAVGLEDYDVADRRLIAFGASKFNEQPPTCWTNNTPAIFELKKDGSLMLFKDGRELHSMSQKVATFVAKREVLHADNWK